jgi:hypothetical protein
LPSANGAGASTNANTRITGTSAGTTAEQGERPTDRQ